MFIIVSKVVIIAFHVELLVLCDIIRSNCSNDFCILRIEKFTGIEIPLSEIEIIGVKYKLVEKQ